MIDWENIGRRLKEFFTYRSQQEEFERWNRAHPNRTALRTDLLSEILRFPLL